MNIIWVLLLCAPTACVSLGVAFTDLAECERELMPTAVLSMACVPRDAI